MIETRIVNDVSSDINYENPCKQNYRQIAEQIVPARQ